MIATKCAECGATFVPEVMFADICDGCADLLEQAYQDKKDGEALEAQMIERKIQEASR